MNIVGGTLTLENCTMDTSANDSVSPITISGGTLILKNCTLIAEVTQDSIAASTAQSVVSYASYANRAVDGNVTVSGLLTVGSYVV